ncbi:uncharacterized protein isoform X2 [Rhodnius prolixus]|uniref:uncharacterized protein isoform X2 n=2 Tax=Rhodnius prolixus TaxID=13249 RepID=UPI003D1888A8
MVAPDSLTDTPMDTNAEKGAANNIPSQSTRNEETTDEKEPLTEEVHKQPSYVALACCISGYTTLSYDSKQRQSLRSRPVSPVRPDSIQNVMFTSEGGKYLLPEPVKINQNMQTEGKGINVMNGCGGLHSPRHVANISLTQESRSFSSSMATESYSYSTTRFTRTNTTTTSSSFSSATTTNGDTSEQLSPSSFIVQRVERLYGPGALAQGFYSPRKAGSSTKATKVTTLLKEETTTHNIEDGKNEQSLPVLKLLRPEFRAQLTVANRKLRTTSIPEKLSSSPYEDIKPEEKRKNSSDQVDATAFVNIATIHPQIEVKDGHYFLKILKENVDILEKLAVEAEKELTELDNEEGCGILRAAAGKARLLVAQKLKQFEGLCLKNIKQSDKEDFPTTNEDLAGFWDMVMIQVNEVVSQFEQINKLRKNDWKNIEETLIAESNRTATTNLQTPNKMQTPRKLATKKTPTSDNSKESSSSSSKARDEARRKMIEERRKAMKEKRQNLDTSVGNETTMFIL